LAVGTYHRGVYATAGIRRAHVNRAWILIVGTHHGVIHTHTRNAGIVGAEIAVVVAVDGVFRNAATARIAFGDRAGIAVTVAEGLAMLVARAGGIAVSEMGR
jgi:hypothetical protein